MIRVDDRLRGVLKLSPRALDVQPPVFARKPTLREAACIEPRIASVTEQRNSCFSGEPSAANPRPRLRATLAEDRQPQLATCVDPGGSGPAESATSTCSRCGQRASGRPLESLSPLGLVRFVLVIPFTDDFRLQDLVRLGLAIRAAWVDSLDFFQ